jgi:hypothetical protein
VGLIVPLVEVRRPIAQVRSGSLGMFASCAVQSRRRRAHGRHRSPEAAAGYALGTQLYCQYVLYFLPESSISLSAQLAVMVPDSPS